MNKKFLATILGVCFVAAVALPCLAVVKAPQNSLTTPAVGVQAVNTSLNAKKEPCKKFREHCFFNKSCCSGYCEWISNPPSGADKVHLFRCA